MPTWEGCGAEVGHDPSAYAYAQTAKIRKPCHEDAPASVCKQWEQCCPRPAVKPFCSSLLQHGEGKGDKERAKTSKGQLRRKQEPSGRGVMTKQPFF